MNRFGPDQVKWHYDQALVLQSIFLLGQKTGEDEFCRYVKSMYDKIISSSGDISGYREDEFNLDQINPGKTLFLLYGKYKSENYLIGIEQLRIQLLKHPRTDSGGFWHKKIYPYQMWLDGLYMQGPFYAQYAAVLDEPETVASSIADIEHQFTLIGEKARDAKTGLLYHAWDESKKQKWANPSTGCSPHFWGRAMGWYCMALVDTLQFIPPSYKKTVTAITNIALGLLDPLMKYQDKKSGLWYQVLDKGGQKGNYTESSASSMFVYFMAKMLNDGLIKDEKKAGGVKDAALKAYQGLKDGKLQEDASGDIHLADTCRVAGLGGEPYRDGSYEYYIGEPKAADDFKGDGAFILASMEIERLSENG